MFISRDGAEVARWAHNPKVGGSIPSPATILRLDGGIGRHEGLKIPWQLRRVGSSPIPSTTLRPGLWCNGSTTGFGSVSLGSNPGRSTKSL